jgi:UTRA domain.
LIRMPSPNISAASHQVVQFP